MLTVFDAAVEDVLHVGAARVGQDAAVAEGARAELHAALEPAEDFAFGDLPRGGVEELSLIHAMADYARGFHLFADLSATEFGAVIGVLHDEAAGFVQDLVPDIGRGSDGRAGIVRSRLHVKFTEGRLLEDLAVGGAVEGAASGEAEGFLPGDFVQVVEEGEVGFFKDQLDGSGHVGVDRKDLAATRTRQAEDIDHFFRKDVAERGLAAFPGHFDAFRVVDEVVEIEPEFAIAAGNGRRGFWQRNGAHRTRRGPSFCTRHRSWGSQGTE